MMPRHTNITDELLSAYLDDAVTASERALVETAVADDPEVAWRLATLQHTVSLLGNLPNIPLARAFTLTEAMVAEPVTEGAGVPIPVSVSRPHPAHKPEKTGFWQAWQSFWQGGNVLLRNAAAASFAAFLVLAVAGATLSPQATTETVSLATQSNALSLEAEQIQSAESEQLQPTESISSLSLNADQDRHDLSTSDAETYARDFSPPPEAPAAMIVQSAPAEPIPLPAESVEEAQSAVALADEPAAPVAERAVEESVSASTNDAPITAAAVAMADESAPEAVMATASIAVADQAAPAAAPMAMAAEDAATDAETAEIAMSDDADAAPEAVAVESVAMPDPAAESNAADDALMTGQGEAAPVEKAEVAQPALSTQDEAPMTTAASTMSVLDSDPLRFMEMIALSLTLLFAALWLLSRRAQSSPQ